MDCSLTKAKYQSLGIKAIVFFSIFCCCSYGQVGNKNEKLPPTRLALYCLLVTQHLLKFAMVCLEGLVIFDNHELQRL